MVKQILNRFLGKNPAPAAAPVPNSGGSVPDELPPLAEDLLKDIKVHEYQIQSQNQIQVPGAGQQMPPPPYPQSSQQMQTSQQPPFQNPSLNSSQASSQFSQPLMDP